MHIHTHMHTLAHTLTHTLSHTHVFTLTTHVHTLIHTLTHTYTHMHTQPKYHSPPDSAPAHYKAGRQNWGATDLEWRKL